MGPRRWSTRPSPAFGDLHVVVNNAGILRDRMLVSMSEQEFDDVIAVHLKGTFNLTRHAADVWRDAAKTGTTTDRAIVNTSLALVSTATSARPTTRRPRRVSPS